MIRGLFILIVFILGLLVGSASSVTATAPCITDTPNAKPTYHYATPTPNGSICQRGTICAFKVR